MKRIVFTVTNDLSYDQRMHRICTSLVKQGYHCLLVGRVLRNSKPLESFDFETRRLRCFFNKGKLFYIEYNIRLLLFLLASRFDAICAVDLDTLVPATLSSRLKGKKLGYDAHEYFTEVPEVVGRKAIKAVWERVARACIPRTDFRYTVGEKLAEELKVQYGFDFDVIRNVPMTRGSRSVQAAQEKILLYQGSLNEGRGLEVLLEAATELPIKVWLAGEGDLSESLRAQATRLDLKDRVAFLGFIPPHMLWNVTQKAYLGYNLLENKGKSYFFSLANKYFDYTMAGVPCLISPFPEYQAFHQKYGHSVLCELNKEDVIRGVKELLGKPEEYNRLQENCYKATQELNWQKEEQYLFKIYGNVFG